MKILFIYEGEYFPEGYLSKFKPNFIVDEREVRICLNSKDAKEFITNEIIKKQLHLDFIIAEYISNIFKIALDEFAS